MTLNREARYLLDSTVFIDTLRRRPTAIALTNQIRQEHISAGYSVITEAELWAGIRTPEFEAAHQILLAPFQPYPFNNVIARHGGHMWRHLEDHRTKGETIPGIMDCLIAATGEYYDLTICTRNEKHFGLFRQFNIGLLIYSEK